MLDSLTPKKDHATVVRLAAVTNTSVQRFLNRGISPESYPEIQERLRKQKIVFEPTQLIDKVFEPSTNPKHTTPFARTRFTKGDKAVFYSALEDETSIEEIKYHQTRRGEFSDLANTPDAPPRYYGLYETNFDGTMLDLFTIHPDCPELTSEDDSGYPKCQRLAEEARSKSMNAFRTPSARQSEGICTPIFDRQSLVSVPRLKSHGRFINEHGKIVFRQV